MSVLTQAFFALVRRHFVTFVLFSVRHSSKIMYYLTFFFTSCMKVLAGLKAGML